MHQCSPRSTCLEKNMQSVPVTSWQYPHFSTQRSTHTHSRTLRVLKKKKKKKTVAPLSKRHRLSDNMPVKLSLAASNMQGKVRLMKKNTVDGGWSKKNHWDMKRLEVRIHFSKIWCWVNAGSIHPKSSTKRSQKNQENLVVWNLLLLLKSTNLWCDLFRLN